MAVIESKPVTIDSMIDDEERRFLARMPQSLARSEESSKVLAGGATSNWMISRPAAVWVSHGKGSRVWDVDGTEYVDLHGGYGVMVAGHANPAIVEAVQRRVTQGTHFAQPTDDSIVVARELASRFGLPVWRFNNSGTEATMDADPSDARRHGSSRDRQDRGQLSRPSRLRDGLAVAQPRHARSRRSSPSRRVCQASHRRWPTSCTSCRSTISRRSSACCTPTRAPSPE